MMKSKEKIIQYLKTFGSIENDILNVEFFINHRVDPVLLNLITDDFIRMLSKNDFDLILTVESSGIPFATALSLKTNKPMIFLKKKKPITMKDYYEVETFSFTKKETTKLYLSKSLKIERSKVVFIDDFFATGNVYNAVIELSKISNFEIVRYLVIINKSDNPNINSILNKQDIEKILYEVKRNKDQSSN